ncbi:hypothetical protein BC828DRAFT_389851 [Blastocladiella britannica]|nr:hypothetical protein BC828DRAFT_389851 [Blastocladiella britannica]
MVRQISLHAALPIPAPRTATGLAIKLGMSPTSTTSPGLPVVKQQQEAGGKYVPPHKRNAGSPLSPTHNSKARRAPKLPAPLENESLSPRLTAIAVSPTWRLHAPALPMAAPKQLQQQQSIQMKQPQQFNKNAQVYRPTPVKEHPDDAFLSGAWMFDSQRVPLWMAAQLPSAPSSQRAAWYPSSSRSRQATGQATTQATAQTPSKHQLMKQQMQKIQNQHKIRSVTGFVYRIVKGSVKEHADTGFLSGAWIFDASRVPTWMQLEVGSLASALVLKRKMLAGPSRNPKHQAKQQQQPQQLQKRPVSASNNNKKPTKASK